MVTTGLSLLSHVSQVLATNLSEANSNPLKIWASGWCTCVNTVSWRFQEDHGFKPALATRGSAS